VWEDFDCCIIDLRLLQIEVFHRSGDLEISAGALNFRASQHQPLESGKAGQVCEASVGDSFASM
jgi:hypothetical protein